MDIVDVDELLKNDSFCLMEEKSQDDITNILQQWKSNSLQGTQLDTRTFTRPKRKSLQNSETSCFNDSSKSYAIGSSAGTSIDLQIGGLVTSLTKNSLRDVSPPFSICSSMDLSVDQLNNSLITSADFTDVSFFKTTNTDDLLTESCDDLFKRNTMENLYLSGDHSLIKDSNIAQTDEIFCLNKIFYDTDLMFNSANNELNSCDAGYSCKRTPELSENTVCPQDTKGGPLKEREGIIQNITFNLIEDTQHLSKPQMNGHSDTSQSDSDTSESRAAFNITFQKDAEQLNKNILQNTFVHGERFDATHFYRNETKLDIDEIQTCSSNPRSQRSKTPENNFQFEENVNLQSTPYISPSYKVKMNITTPILSFVNEIALSPIESTRTCPFILASSRNLMNNKFKKVDKYLEKDIVLTKNFDQGNKDTEICYYSSDEELFTKENEDDLNKLLKTFGKTPISAESNKLRQSLNIIKKRHSLVSDQCVTDTSKLTTIMSFSSSLNSERLLKRRSRLYDEVPLENIEQNSNKSFKENDKLCETNEDLNGSLSHKEIVASANTVKNLNCCKNQERFKTIRNIRKTEDQDIEGRVDDAIAQNSLDTRFSRKAKNYLTSNSNNSERKSNNKNSKKNYKENDELNCDFTDIYQGNKSSIIDVCKNTEFSSKINLASSLEKQFSESSSAKRSILNHMRLHANEGILSAKTNSYHYITSKFGFSKAYEEPSLQQKHVIPGEQKINSEQQIKLDRTTQSKSMLNGSKEKNGLFKIPAGTQTRTSNTRRSGLVRPSSGFYSYNVNKSECEVENSRHSSSNSLSSLSSKGSVQELHKKIVNEHFSDDNTEKFHDDTELTSKRAFSRKSNIPKPSGPKSTNIKRSILPLSSPTARR